MANAETTSGRVRAPLPRADADPATRRKVLDTAVACIVERGFYRASSNEIARRAGMTWGVIQYHFGTRERLMVAVLEDTSTKFVEHVEHANIDAADVTARLQQLIALLSDHYGTPEFLAYTQILLSMENDPSTSDEVRGTLRSVDEQAHSHVRRLLRQTLGDAKGDTELASTLFLLVRGFAVSQQLLSTMSYESVSGEGRRTARQRTVLAKMLTPYLRELGG